MAAVVLPSSPKNFVMVWTGAIWGLLPDLLQLPYMFKFRKAPISWTQKIHDFFHSEDESLKKEKKKIVSQVVIVLACMTIVYMI
jgi:hypothetical protein